MVKNYRLNDHKFDFSIKLNKSLGSFYIYTSVTTNVFLLICVVSLEIMNLDTFATAALLNQGCES